MNAPAPAFSGASRSPLLLASVALALAVIVALGVGPLALSPTSILAALLRGMQGVQPGDTVAAVIWNIRLPRVAAALLVGAALAAAGSAYQAMFRNPLVSPDILGVSSGAGLGALLGIYLHLPVVAIQGLAFLGGLGAVALVTFAAARVRRHDPVLVLVLAGVAMGALLGAAMSLLKVLADPYTQLPAMTYWLLGSLSATTRADVIAATPIIVAALAPLVMLRWRINLLSLPDEEALSLGVPVHAVRWTVIVAATLMTAAAVAISGVIGWVGLVVPHLARLIVGPDYRRLLPMSLLVGAGFLVVADTVARTGATIEMPLGVITALTGAPFLLWLLARARRAW